MTWRDFSIYCARERNRPFTPDLTVGLTIALAAAQAGLVTVRTNTNAQKNHQFIEAIRAGSLKDESLEELKACVRLRRRLLKTHKQVSVA